MAPRDADASLPDVAQVLAPILARVPRAQQPLLLALAERLAAVRYRGWAAQPELRAQRADLLACAEREERIAESVESLFPDAAAAQAEIRERNPDLEQINRDLFAARPLRDQLAIQARGEHLGATTWRSFAREADERRRERFEACACLEEESAAVLEGILRGGTALAAGPTAKPGLDSSI